MFEDFNWIAFVISVFVWLILFEIIKWAWRNRDKFKPVPRASREEVRKLKKKLIKQLASDPDEAYIFLMQPYYLPVLRDLAETHTVAKKHPRLKELLAMSDEDRAAERYLTRANSALKRAKEEVKRNIERGKQRSKADQLESIFKDAMSVDVFTSEVSLDEAKKIMKQRLDRQQRRPVRPPPPPTRRNW